MAPRASSLPGEQPSETIPSFLDAADVLVSPRSTGTNTPLKIYQYLRSGRVIVATRLLTHTQVLSDDVAILTEPTPEAFARGVLRAINEPSVSRQLGEAARRLADTRYTYDAYLQRTREACAALSSPLKTRPGSFSDRVESRKKGTRPLFTITATRRMPTRRWRRGSTRRASADPSASCCSRIRSACCSSFLATCRTCASSIWAPAPDARRWPWPDAARA